jgi:hypothetical protein
VKLKVGFAAVLAATTIVLSGCVVFLGPVTSAQQDVIGKLRVSFTICASGFNDGDDPDPENEDHPGCPDTGSGGEADSGSTYQVLVAFRVPAGTGAPANIVTDPAPTPPAGGPVSLTRSPTYESELQTLAPRPGFAWVGYISQPYAFDDGADDVPAQTAQMSVDFDLPRPAGGGPFAGPFRVRPVVGFRAVGLDLPASRRVSCGDSLFGGAPFSSTVCVDSPTPAITDTDLQFATRDLGVLGGAATASPGQTVQLPFNANLNGTLPAGTTFLVSAATNLPRVTVAPSPASFTPAANASTRITVPVAIPKTAGPGTFDVSVTASLPNGQTRTGVSKLTVRDRQKPVARGLAIRPKTIRPQAPSVAAPARVSYRLSEAATMRFRIQRCRRVKRKTRCRTLRGAFTHAGKAGTNRFRFTGFLRNRALKAGRYRLVGTPTDLAKNKGKSVRASFRIKR